MEQLQQQTKVLLGTVFSFYLKAHNFHWNVTSQNFSELHEFFGGIYETVWESVDGIAEQIRQLDAFAPGSYSRFSELSMIADETNIPNAKAMIAKLTADNDIVINELNKTHALATAQNELGLVNYLEGLIMYHKKIRWMLKAFQG